MLKSFQCLNNTYSLRGVPWGPRVPRIMNISKICRMLDSQAKIQKVKRSLQKSRLSGSFRRTCLLRPVILILESPEKCVKPQISVPQPQTSSFSGSVQRPSICTCHTSSDGAAAPTPGTAQGTTDLLPAQ